MLGLMVLVAAGVGAAIAFSGSDEDDTARDQGTEEQPSDGPSGDPSDTAPTDGPTLDLPVGCDFLSDTQVAALIPGEITVKSHDRDNNRNCDWSNFDDGGEESKASISFSLTAHETEGAAVQRLATESCVNGERISLEGADDACVDLVSNPTGTKIGVRKGAIEFVVSYNAIFGTAQDAQQPAIGLATSILGRLGTG